MPRKSDEKTEMISLSVIRSTTGSKSKSLIIRLRSVRYIPFTTWRYDPSARKFTKASFKCAFTIFGPMFPFAPSPKPLGTPQALYKRVNENFY